MIPFKRIVFFSVLILWTQSLLFGQRSEKDSLLSFLKTVTNDSVKINTLVDLAYIEYQNDLDKAFMFTNEAYELSKKINNKHQISVCLNILGNLCMERHSHRQAIEYYKKSSVIAENLKDTAMITKVLGNMGLVYLETGNFVEAFSYQYKCMALLEKQKDIDGLATVYNNIGNLYYEQEIYDKAMEFHQKSLQYREKLNDKNGIVTSLNNIGAIYDALKKIDTAIAIHEKALKIEIEIDDKFGMAYSYNNIGGLFEQKKLRDRALAFYLKSLAIREEIHDDDGIASCYLNIGILNRKFKKYTEAFDYLNKARELTEKIGKRSLLKDIYAQLSDVYIEQGNYKDGFKFHQLFMQTKDSLFNIETNDRVADIRFQYEFDKKEAISKLEQENRELVFTQEKRQQKIIIYSVSIGFVLICLLSIFIYRGYRIKQRSNIQLENMNKVIVEKNKNITDSINYAKRIQTALMTSEKFMQKSLDRLVKKK